MAKKTQLNEMISLINRMDKPQSGWATMLQEGIDEELDARGREEVPTEQFFDMVAKMRGGCKSTIGYISKAKLNVPQGQKLNPATKRMNKFDDWAAFGKEIGEEKEIVGVIKFGIYTFNWRSPKSMTNHYNKDWVGVVNPIRADHGLPTIKKREPYTSTVGYGNGAVNVYNGANQELATHSYSPQDLGGKDVTKKEIVYYIVFNDGTMKAVEDINILKPYFKDYAVDGVAAMRKLGKSDEEIKAYADKISAIPFRYTNFEHSSVVFVITKINKVPKRFFNKNLTSAIKDITVNPQEFINIARQKYQLEQENMADDLGEFEDDYTDVGE